MTGTPVQNNLHESWALLHFLLPKIFSDSSTFDEAFNLNPNQVKGKPTASNQPTVEKQGKGDGGPKRANTTSVNRVLLAQAHYMLRPFILRRLKSEVEQTLPPKKEIKIDCRMTAMQKFWVRHLLLREKDAMLAMDEQQREANAIGG